MLVKFITGNGKDTTYDCAWKQEEVRRDGDGKPTSAIVKLSTGEVFTMPRDASAYYVMDRKTGKTVDSLRFT